MGTPTFSSFNDVVRELEDVYGHQELWLYSGLNEDSPIETARRRQKWRSPKILKRNGRMVAEQSGQPDFWVLTGDYHLPQSEHSAPPWKACLINKVFKVYCSLLGKNMTDCVTRTGDDKTMWLVTLPEIITNNSTRQEENLVVILSREESWGPTSDHFPDGLYRVSCIMTLYLADTELTKTQTFTAIYWPQQKALHLFTDEFRLERRLQGLGLGSWITQQFVLWARGLPPATLVLPIEISRVDEENEENKIRRDRLWHAMGFRFPAGKPAQCRCGQTNCSCHGAGAQRSGWSPWYPRYAGWKTVIAGCRKNRAARRQKTVAKTVNYFT
jgi:hypothetical protein